MARSEKKRAPEPALPDAAPKSRGRTVDPAELRRWIEEGAALSVLDAIVTPELAEIMLEYNATGVTNRPIMQRHVAITADAIKAEHWENTGEPIIFSSEKIMNDGQHRCSGIILAGTPAICDLRFGVARRAFINTNSGRGRTAGDALNLMGIENYRATAAAARMVLCYEAGLPESAWRIYTTHEITAAVERWPDLQHAVNLTGGLKAPLRNSVTNTLSFFALMTSEGETQYSGFFEVLKHGGGDPEAAPHMLREYMRGTQTSLTRSQRVQTLALGIIAWNHWRQRRKPGRRLTWRSNQSFPVVNGLVLK